MKILILKADSSGSYPVPATRGGAVETLIEHLIQDNEDEKCCDLEILTYYDKDAYDKSNKYPNTNFIWVMVPDYVKRLDYILFRLVRFIRNDERVKSYKSLFSLLYYLRYARKILRNTEADKIVMENFIPLALALKNIKYKGQWYFHFHNVPRIDAGCRNVMAGTTRFLCVSQYVADQICSDVSAIGKRQRDRVGVLYNCVDSDLFRPLNKNSSEIIELKEKYRINDDDKILIFTGRLSEEKGADRLLMAMRLLPSNVKALLVGSFFSNTNMHSIYQDRLHELANELGDRVIFTGYVRQEALPLYYNLADIAVLPSIWEEPAGLTNLEAMSCGIPVITTNAGGISEYVDSSAVLQRDDNLVKNIVFEVIRLINDSEYYTERSNRGRKLVEDKFDRKQYMRRFMRLLNDN